MHDPRVPKLDLAAHHARVAGEIEAAIARVMASQRFVRGEEVAALEREVADYCEVAHAVACANGSDAILLALMARGVGPGDLVVCPAYTFFSTAAAPVRLGATPVFADVDPETYCVDAARVRAAVERAGAPAAIIAVHLFGRAAPMDELVALADELSVPLVEDAAQAIGARDGAGVRAGTRGHAGCLSFYPTKNLGALGDGGMILTGDAALAEQLRVLRDHGEGPAHEHRVVGINSRLDALQAAVLRAKLGHLDAWTGERLGNVALYHELFRDAGAEVGDGGFDGLTLPVRLPAPPERPAVHVFNQYVIRVPGRHRDALCAELARVGVGTEIYYRRALHEQPCYAEHAGQLSLPEAEAAARETIALPIQPELTKDQLAFVVASVRRYFDVADRGAR